MPSPRWSWLLVGLAAVLALLRAVVLDGAQTVTGALLLGGALAIAGVADAVLSLRTARSAAIRVVRTLPRALAHGAPQRVTLTARVSNPRVAGGWTLQVQDGTDPTLDVEGLPAQWSLAGEAGAGGAESSTRADTLTYRVVPRRRGTVRFGHVELQTPSRWGLWTLRGRVAAPAQREVLPDFAAIARYAWFAGDRRLSTLGIKAYVGRGAGTDFRQLTDYREGDPVRHIDWKATIRRGKPVAREYQDERDQTVMVLLDCGRRLRAWEPGTHATQFDLALDALMLLAWVALKEGDQVGVMTFAHAAGAQRHLAPRPGRAQLDHMMTALHDVQPGDEHPDYLDAARRLMRVQQRRALVIVLTNFRDEDASELAPALRLMRTRHMVMVASLRDRAPDQIAAQPLDSARSAVEVATAHWQSQRRARALQSLAARDRLIVDTAPDRLAAALVNRYHAVKRARAL